MAKEAYNWKYASVGGSVRVKIETGEDIAHLAELDRKKWTVLSCPVEGLEFDAKTLRLLDSNGDGRIHVDEVIAASQWLTGVLKNPDDLVKGESSLPLKAFSDSEEGQALKKSAKQILQNLGLKKDSISLEDTADNTKIFAATRFNGDGVITEATAGEDAELAGLVKTITEVTGGTPDRSGAQGVSAEQIEAFYAAAADFAGWKDAAGKEVFPYGDDTPAALAAVDAVKAKVADFFMRCKLIGFDANAAGAVDVDVDKIKAISEKDLAESAEEIASYPLARPNDKGLLPLDGGINPAWQGAFASLKALVLDKEFKGKKGISEADWAGVLAKFGPYTAWAADKKGAEVEGLGLDAVKAILKEDKKAALLELVEKDKALEAEALSIEAVDKLLHFYRDFYTFLKNYVVFQDFYADGPALQSVWQAGRLFIEQRRCDLCVRVADMGKHGDMSSLSGMYIIYADCLNKPTGKKLSIAAVLTDGDIDGLRPGKNAIFYDRDGLDYDAVVTKIIDNPISIRQAFWAPYRKFGKWIGDKFKKSAEEKDAKGFNDMTASANTVKLEGNADKAAASAASAFDIAKFAGIFAAIGMALGFLGTALVAVARGIAAIKFWQLLLIIAGIMLVISGPSMILAWLRLRKRDLGALLNANGWAVNAASYINIKFGATLTSLVKYPLLKAVDPEEAKKVRRRKCFWYTLLCIIVACGVLFFLNWKHVINIPYLPQQQPKEQVVEAPAEEAPAAEVQAEEAAPAEEAALATEPAA